MTERERGYQQGIADAERVCSLLAQPWLSQISHLPEGRKEIARLIADALALAGKSIRDLEPGFISPKE